MPLRGRESLSVRRALKQSGSSRNGPPERIPNTGHVTEEEETTAELAYPASDIRVGGDRR